MMSRMKALILLIMFLPALLGCAADLAQAPVESQGGTPAAAGATEVQGPRILGITVRDEAERQVIDIEADRPLLFTMYKPSDPFQVVVELTAASLNGNTDRILVDRDSILDIVPEQVDLPSPMARLEIGLTAPLTITPRVEGNRLLLDVPRLRPIDEGEQVVVAPVEEIVEEIEPETERVPAFDEAEPMDVDLPAVEEVAEEPPVPVAVAAIAAGLADDGSAPAEEVVSTPSEWVPEAAPLDRYPVPEETPVEAIAESYPAASVPEAEPMDAYPVPEGFTAPVVAPAPVVESVMEPVVNAPERSLLAVEVTDADETVDVVLRTDGEVAPEVYAIEGKRLIIDLPGVQTIARGSVGKVLPPIKAVRTGMYRDKARTVIDLYIPSEYDVRTGPTGVVVALTPPPPVVSEMLARLEEGDEGMVETVPATEAAVAAAAEKAAEALAVAELAEPEEEEKPAPKISLDFQDADVVQVFRLLADVGGYNLVVHPEVKGKIPSLKLENVPWDQALEIVLKLSGQGKVLEGNILRIAPPAVFAREHESVVETRVAKEKAEDLFQRIIAVNYADAGELRTAIEQSKILSPRGNITIDTRMNTLIVQDVQTSIDKVLDLVRIMDVAKPQVMIESRLVTVRTTAARDLGIDWSGTFDASATTGNPTGAYFPNSITGSLATNVGLGQALPNFIVSLGSVDDLFTLNLQIAAIEESNDGRTLANPRVLTMDNEEAEVKQGTKIPYKTVSDQGTQTSFVDATLSLKVTPRITPGGYVQLKIVATRNSVGVNTPDGPSIDLNEVMTQALVKDGETVVVGGIYTKDTVKRETRIPVLGEIPGLGWFFKSTTDTEELNELLIFITPRIVKGRVAL